MSKSSKAREKFEKISKAKSMSYLNSTKKPTWDEMQAKKLESKPKEKVSDKFRRELVSKATKSELIFKSFLDKNMISYSFQKVIYVSVDCKQKFYIADFLFKQYNLIVELDGGYHNSESQKEKDNMRTIHLRRAGYFVLRFDNSRVSDCKSIYADIVKFISEKFGEIDIK